MPRGLIGTSWGVLGVFGWPYGRSRAVLEALGAAFLRKEIVGKTLHLMIFSCSGASEEGPKSPDVLGEGVRGEVVWLVTVFELKGAFVGGLWVALCSLEAASEVPMGPAGVAGVSALLKDLGAAFLR